MTSSPPALSVVRPPAVPRANTPLVKRTSELERMQATVRDLEMKRERAAGFVYDAGERYRCACDAVERGREALERIRRRAEMPPAAADANVAG
jgi:hypothetical protein